MSKILELPKPKPDVDDLRKFIECVFRGATAADGFVGLRRFQNNDDGKSRTPWAPLNGELVPTALAVADEAASAGWGDDGWSFAPPVCLFGAKIKENGYRSAEQANVSFCSVIVIDADERPEEVRSEMTRILGEPTMIVASGGTWEGQEKLHLYWRLTEPARDPETLERLRKARKRAVAIARTDPSIAPLNHPIRWPGSLHTKREPRRCRIVSFTDQDIDLNYAEFVLSMAGGGLSDEPDGNVFAAGDGRRVSFSTRMAWSRKQLDEAARIIPNDDRSWDDWNKIAMAFYDASHASSDGLEAMIAWSSKSDKFENDVCESRWSHFHESPPSRLSAGTLRHLMGEVDERYKSKPGASAEDWFEALDEAAIEFTPLGDDWRAALLAERSGKQQVSVISCVTNAIVPLRHASEWRGVVRQNKLLGETWMCQPAPWMKTSERAAFKPRAWADTDDIRATEWVQRAGVPVGEKLVSQAVETVAEENGFDPVIDYLNGLVWDGTPRIETWLIDYMEADDTVFVRAVASRFLISAVARAYRPGCKSDTMLILEGEQGKRKSSAIDVLGGPFYSDDSGEIGTKDGALLASGAWIVEMGELDALSKVEATRIKAFLSRRIDRYRPPFGRRPVSRPRPSVYVGTTNGDTYLKDETGGRRFWPVYVHGADIARLTLDRDQLWAEAVVAYKAGRPWWLETSELTTLAEAEQGSRYEEDAWTDRISAWLQQENLTDVSPVEVMSGCLHIPVPQQNRACSMRVNRVLRSIGWEKYRTGRGSPRRYKRSAGA